MRCAACGFENPEGIQFCGGCGAALANRCPRCGFANPAAFRFCGQCAAPLGVDSHAAPSPPAPSPGAYTPPHLAERIRAEQAALEARAAPDGERKTVTALFADITGSMELMEELDPEEARRIVDPVLQLMMDAVHRYDGYVVQSRTLRASPLSVARNLSASGHDKPWTSVARFEPTS